MDDDDFNGGGHAKPHKPPIFEGSKTEFDSWWHQVQLYLALTNEERTEKTQILFVLSYMQKGYAGEWASSFFDKQEALPPAQRYQWNNFVDVLLKAFAPLNKVQEAQAEMARFKQGRMPIEEYLTRWSQLLVKAKYITVEAETNSGGYRGACRRRRAVEHHRG